MELQEIPENKLIVHSNTITESRFEYSRQQMDLLFMIMAQLGKADKPNQIYSIYLKDVEHITNREWHYKQLDNAVSGMGDRHFHIQKEGSLDWKKIWLLQSVEYISGEGRVEIKLTDDAREHLFDLKENFTVFQLSSALSLSSQYSKRIYTICCRWRDTYKLKLKGYVILSIDELKYMLGIKTADSKQDKYSKICNFRSRVLDVAVKDINENTDVHFEYELIKKQSRLFTHIKMIINPQDKKQLEIQFSDQNNMEMQRRIGEMVASGLSHKQAEKLTNDYNYKAFKEAKELTIEAMKKGKIKTTAEAFMIGILQKKATNFS